MSFMAQPVESCHNYQYFSKMITDLLRNVLPMKYAQAELIEESSSSILFSYNCEVPRFFDIIYTFTRLTHFGTTFDDNTKFISATKITVNRKPLCVLYIGYSGEDILYHDARV